MARARGRVLRVLRPFRLTDCLTGAHPVLLLDREVDVGVRVRLPTLALEYPAGLSTAAGVAAAWDRIAKRPIWILRVFFQVAHAIQALLVAQLDAAQVQHRILHRHGHLLTLAGLLTGDQCGQQADGQMHAGIAVAECRCADRGRTVPKAGCRCGSASALRDVFIDLEVLVRRAFAKAFNRAEDEPRVELLNVLPSESHPVHRARPEVLDEDIGPADQLL